jgi:hypothetical protein
MNRPPGLVYNSALFSSDILSLYVGHQTVQFWREGLTSSRRFARFSPSILYSDLLIFASEGKMKQSDTFLENAENCALMAEQAPNESAQKRFKRMEAAWRALAEEQDWLDGETPPVRIATNGRKRKTPPRGANA